MSLLAVSLRPVSACDMHCKQRTGVKAVSLAREVTTPTFLSHISPQGCDEAPDPEKHKGGHDAAGSNLPVSIAAQPLVHPGFCLMHMRLCMAPERPQQHSCILAHCAQQGLQLPGP